jgi:hypothetical protein
MVESESPASDATEKHVGKGTASAITFAIGTVAAYAANHLASKEQRELLTNLAPSVGLVASLVFGAAARQYYHWRGNRRLAKWIKELQAERPKANRIRQAAIDTEVAEYRAKLKQRRLDNLP